MLKSEKITFKDLNNDSAQPLHPLNWRKPSGEIGRVVLPKSMTGTKANVVVLCPDNFPTGSSNDGPAYFNVKYLIDNKKIVNNTVEICAFDSSIVSYAWACSIMGLKCIIRTPQTTYPYWMKKAANYGAKIEVEGTKLLDVMRIMDLHKKKSNFICDVQTPLSYTFHASVTGKAIIKAVDGVGNNKIVLLSYPASSGGLTGAATVSKKTYPYSKNILTEPTASSTFYNNKKGPHKLYGSGYGFIPYIHNIMATDYVMLIQDDEAIKVLKCFEEFNSKVAAEFGLDSKTIKPLVGKFGISTTACIISAINLAQQLHLSPDDNVLIIGEDTAAPYKEAMKSESVSEMDVKSIIEDAFIKTKFRPVIDVTGQRQRERLFRKKIDFWMKRGMDENILNKMKDKQYWDNLPSY